MILRAADGMSRKFQKNENRGEGEARAGVASWLRFHIFDGDLSLEKFQNLEVIAGK